MPNFFLVERVYELSNLDFNLSSFNLGTGPDLAGLALLAAIFSGVFALRLGKTLRDS
tara:strand:+ start:275 stop:445 length:171 start_codon:yes stop_codon:yes gene_type:complete